jgi:hypothetical protein
VDAGANRTQAYLPKDEAEKPDRALVNFPPDISEATVSVAVKLNTPIPVNETGERNACEV